MGRNTPSGYLEISSASGDRHKFLINPLKPLRDLQENEVPGEGRRATPAAPLLPYLYLDADPLKPLKTSIAEKLIAKKISR